MNKLILLIILAVLALTITACREQEETRPVMTQLPVVNEPAVNDPVPPVVEPQPENVTTQPAPTSEVKELNVEMFDFGIRTNDVVIKKGDTVRLTVTNTAGTHGFALPAYGIDVKPGSGSSKTVEFVADKAGTFDYRCNIPCGSGHMSMKGSLVVTE